MGVVGLYTLFIAVLNDWHLTPRRVKMTHIRLSIEALLVRANHVVRVDHWARAMYLHTRHGFAPCEITEWIDVVEDESNVIAQSGDGGGDIFTGCMYDNATLRDEFNTLCETVTKTCAVEFRPQQCSPGRERGVGVGCATAVESQRVAGESSADARCLSRRYIEPECSWYCVNFDLLHGRTTWRR